MHLGLYTMVCMSQSLIVMDGIFGFQTYGFMVLKTQHIIKFLRFLNISHFFHYFTLWGQISRLLN